MISDDGQAYSGASRLRIWPLPSWTSIKDSSTRAWMLRRVPLDAGDAPVLTGMWRSGTKPRDRAAGWQSAVSLRLPDQ